ncbi:cupin domain-containing protein [Sphingomonas sp. So64.6b]|uniref:cupin domain-containing protein n=1 Tax=Sphingomonas sp. So64.6b TaxID=2997354 RepID=UPI0015FF3BCF|nr:cupin domain-containing protein [Sphingomonas sp. So64.6b]QNA83520.1 cupin domain-containing protein [Sphingomonas sp. So64.6b]
MVKILRHRDPQAEQSRTVRFEGQDFGTPVSFFLVDVGPGQGSVLHRHPYSETWIVRHGEADLTVGDGTVRGYPGDIVVAPADIPHRFVNAGAGRLELVCIHANGTIVQENV